MEETLKEEEAKESGVTFGIASSPDDITALLLLSKQPLPVCSNLLLFKEREAARGKEMNITTEKRWFMDPDSKLIFYY